MPRNLCYAYTPCAAGLTCRADPERVRQILLNLLSNAIKFTQPGGTVLLSCQADASHVRIQVRDTGRGIPAEKLNSVFEPFVQLDRHLSQPADGTGLGLSISRDLARAMRGELSVESQPGAGSIFTLTLPRT